MRLDRGKNWKWCWIIIPPSLSTAEGLGVTDELIHHTHHSADSCHCRSSTPTPQLHLSDCICGRIPSKSWPLLTWKHNHTHLHTRHVPKPARSHIYLALHIYGYAQMAVPSQAHTHTEIPLGKIPLIPHFSQSSGPASGLIVCGGLLGTLWHWLMKGTFSVKMPHWPHSGTPITHSTSAQVFPNSPCGCVPTCFSSVGLDVTTHPLTQWSYIKRRMWLEADRADVDAASFKQKLFQFYMNNFKFLLVFSF